LDSVYGLLNWDPLWILRQGAVVLARSAKDSSQVHSKKTKFTDANAKDVIAEQVQNSKVLHLLPIFTHP
jgi:cation transporter-like permease